MLSLWLSILSLSLFYVLLTLCKSYYGFANNWSWQDSDSSVQLMQGILNLAVKLSSQFLHVQN